MPSPQRHQDTKAWFPWAFLASWWFILLGVLGLSPANYFNIAAVPATDDAGRFAQHETAIIIQSHYGSFNPPSDGVEGLALSRPFV